MGTLLKVIPIFILILHSVKTFSLDINKSRETVITRAIEKVGPAVASINVEQHITSLSYDPFFGFIYPNEIYPMKNSGSGVVISQDGFVLTNYHVIKNADKISVTLSGGDEYVTEVIGFDETSDIALLKLDGLNFPYAKLAFPSLARNSAMICSLKDFMSIWVFDHFRNLV